MELLTEGERGPVSLLGVSEINKLKGSNLTLDCPQMRLVTPANEVVYSGAGNIRQTGDGQIEFTLYDSQRSAGLDEIKRLTTDVGDFISADEFMSLIAVDLEGRT